MSQPKVINRLRQAIEEDGLFTCSDCRQIKPAADLASIDKYKTFCNQCREPDD